MPTHGLGADVYRLSDHLWEMCGARSGWLKAGRSEHRTCLELPTGLGEGRYVRVRTWIFDWVSWVGLSPKAEDDTGLTGGSHFVDEVLRFGLRLLQRRHAGVDVKHPASNHSNLTDVSIEASGQATND